MNCLLRPRVWPFFSPSCRLYEPEAGRPRAMAPATYRSDTPRDQPPAVARWHTHLRGLATSVHETSWLASVLSTAFAPPTGPLTTDNRQASQLLEHLYLSVFAERGEPALKH
jgi:hypothetical protein